MQYKNPRTQATSLKVTTMARSRNHVAMERQKRVPCLQLK